MKHGSTNRRQRNRGHGGNNGRRGGNQRSQVFDSNGPDVRIRGTASQVAEKYKALAKDAASAGDRSLEENYLQHAEHYQRVINAWDADMKARQPVEPVSASVDKSSVSPSEIVTSSSSKVSDEDLSLPASVLGAPSDAGAGAEAVVETRSVEMAE